MIVKRIGRGQSAHLETLHPLFDNDDLDPVASPPLAPPSWSRKSPSLCPTMTSSTTLSCCLWFRYPQEV